MSLRAKTTKIEICSLQLVLRGWASYPGHLRALVLPYCTTLLVGELLAGS